MTSSREEQHDFAACVLVLLCASAERHARPKADRKRQCQKPEGEKCTSGFASQMGAAAAVSEQASSHSPARKTREERRLKGYTLAFKTTGQTKGGRRRVHWLQLWNPAFVWSLGVLIPIRVLKRTNSGKSVVCASEMPQAEDSPMVARACRQGGLPLKDAALQRIARSLCPKPLRCTGLARAQEQRASGARTWPAGPRRRITSTWLKPCMPNVTNGAK